MNKNNIFFTLLALLLFQFTDAVYKFYRDLIHDILSNMHRLLWTRCNNNNIIILHVYIMYKLYCLYTIVLFFDLNSRH